MPRVVCAIVKRHIARRERKSGCTGSLLRRRVRHEGRLQIDGAGEGRPTGRMAIKAVSFEGCLWFGFTSIFGLHFQMASPWIKWRPV